MNFLSANSRFAVQNAGTYLLRITRETCTFELEFKISICGSYPWQIIKLCCSYDIFDPTDATTAWTNLLYRIKFRWPKVYFFVKTNKNYLLKDIDFVFMSFSVKSFQFLIVLTLIQAFNDVTNGLNATSGIILKILFRVKHHRTFTWQQQTGMVQNKYFIKNYIFHWLLQNQVLWGKIRTIDLLNLFFYELFYIFL